MASSPGAPGRSFDKDVFTTFSRQAWARHPRKWSDFGAAASFLFRRYTTGFSMLFRHNSSAERGQKFREVSTAAAFSPAVSRSAHGVSHGAQGGPPDAGSGLVGDGWSGSGLVRFAAAPGGTVHDSWLRVAHVEKGWYVLARTAAMTADDVKVSVKKQTQRAYGPGGTTALSLRAVYYLHRRLTSSGKIRTARRHRLKACADTTFALPLVATARPSVAAHSVSVSRRGAELGQNLIFALSSSLTLGTSLTYSVPAARITASEFRLEYADQETIATLYKARKSAGVSVVQWTPYGVVTGVDAQVSKDGLLCAYVLAVRLGPNTAFRVRGTTNDTYSFAFHHRSGRFTWSLIAAVPRPRNGTRTVALGTSLAFAE